ncbi:MAG TPA: GyrI-like domain-containing protein [Solirubrobacter sp.]
MTKLDLTRDLRELYRATTRPVIVDVPKLRYAMLDGHGDPATEPGYRAAVEALYAVSYAAKFAVKRSGGPDCKVMPLEGLWWALDMAAFRTGDRAAWQWTLLIAQPDPVTAGVFEAARDDAAARHGADPIARVRLETLAEGQAAQVMHVGSYSAEGPTIERLHAFIAEQGLDPVGRHHEIYVSDPRRTAPERLRTIIRQPVA